MKRTLMTIAALFITLAAAAFTRVEIKIHSEAMNKDIPVIVALPDGYQTMNALRTVYLLHGYGDNYTAWSEKGNACPMADTYGVIIVMPDGGFDSWYYDSPVEPTYRYETFVARELVEYIDSHYRTKAEPSARAIAGLSMGGHGALYLAIRHQDVFGAAGSLSGGVDIRPFPDNWNIAKRLGTLAEHPDDWERNTVINMIDQINPDSLKIIFDCGTEDFFYEVNCALHDKLMEAHIPHDFYQRPGVHNWDYWRYSLKYHMLFFDKFFHSDSDANN